MKCFQLVKTVLDEAYAEIDKSDEEKDILITDKIEYLKRLYGDISSAPDIPYEEPITRFAYIYKYVTSHANIVYQLISQSPELAQLFQNDSLDVSCIGGGPGSDFIGIMKYAEEGKNKPNIFCNIIDKETTWAECWGDIAPKLGAKFTFHTNFLPIDVCSKNIWRKHSKYFQADLFTMIYFLSEIDKFRNNAETYLNHLFSNIKSGALVLYVDNRNQRYYGFFDKIIQNNGLNIISNATKSISMPTDEQKTDLGDYYSKFETPKLGANVAWRIARKL